MKRGVKPALVGAFVLGAIGLGLLAIVMFGSGHLFSETTQFICYFSSDVTGLSVGAPVRFHGVDVGSVTKIMLALNFPNAQGTVEVAQIRIPVIITLDLDRITELGGPVDLTNPTTFKRLIDEGLRAQLATESLVTGLRYVALDLNPDHPAHFYGDKNSKYLEIPTIPTTLQQAQTTAEQLLKRLESVNIEQLVQSLTLTVNAMRDVMTSRQLNATLTSLHQATLSLKATADSVRRLANDLDAQMHPLQRGLESLAEASNNANAALKTVQTTLAPDSPLVYRITDAMTQLAAAARATQELADYLQRDPAALLRGRAVARDRQ